MRLEISSTRSCVSRATWRSSQSGDPPAGAAAEDVVANIAAGLRGAARGAWRVRGKRAGGSWRGQRATIASLRGTFEGRNSAGKQRQARSFARTSSDRVRRDPVRSRRTAWRPPFDRGVAGMTRTRGAWEDRASPPRVLVWRRASRLSSFRLLASRKQAVVSFLDAAEEWFARRSTRA